MPPRKQKKSAPRRRRAAPRRARKGVGRKSKTNVSEFASCSVIRTVDPTSTTTNRQYSWDNFALQDYDRAVAIAKQYQHYRITGITVRMKPAYDTYSLGGGSVVQKPNLYYMIDKAGSIPDNFTLEALKQMGARPHSFDENPVKINWRPSVLQEDLNIAGAASATQYKISPWLATNGNATNPGAWVPSTVAHQGLKWYIDQPGGSTTVYVEIEVQFQFKKPLMPTLSSTPALGLVYAQIDDSRDGIVGGNDTSPSLY